ncbi:MAG: hypothetical protein K0U98_08050 [Deltaproteobacteria bacterium]|nr:hypothetical protein [Deltaproteobacteria bacterium]
MSDPLESWFLVADPVQRPSWVRWSMPLDRKERTSVAVEPPSLEVNSVKWLVYRCFPADEEHHQALGPSCSPTLTSGTIVPSWNSAVTKDWEWKGRNGTAERCEALGVSI